MKKIYLAILASVILLPLAASAQDDAGLYMDSAGGAALLYRGHKAYTYPSPFNGTFYWTGPAFEQGSVVYNGKTYRDIPLNIDAAKQDLLIRTLSGGSFKVLSREYVERFNVGSRNFLNLKKIYGEGAPDGYWEVLYGGKAMVVKQVIRTLQQDLDGHLRSEMGYYDPGYRADVHNIFTYRALYCYIDENGQVWPVRRRSQLMKFYKDKKRDINRHISRLEASGMLSFEQFCKEAVSFAETL